MLLEYSKGTCIAARPLLNIEGSALYLDLPVKSFLFLLLSFDGKCSVGYIDLDIFTIYSRDLSFDDDGQGAPILPDDNVR